MNAYASNSLKSRFAANSLTNLTESTLTGLQSWFRENTVPGKEINEFISTYLKTGMSTLCPAERTLVQAQVMAKMSGTHYDGSDIEGMTVSHGTQLTYNLEQRQIELRTKVGETTIIPILPIMPPCIPADRPGLASNVNFLVSNFDISKGVLTTIRQTSTMTVLWGGAQSRFEPTKLPVVYEALKEIINANPTKLFAGDQTLGGLACSDMYYRLLGECNMNNYVALAQSIVDCLKHFVIVNREANITQVIEAGVKVFPFDVKSLRVMKGEPGETFKRAHGFYPRTLVGPIRSMSIWTAQTAVTAETLCNDYRKLTSLLGGNSRGMGKVASSANFCPRQSEATMELNWLLKVVSSIGKAQEIDIKCSKSIISLVRNFLRDSGYTAAKIIKHSEDLKGFVDMSMIQSQSRPDACLVIWNHYTDVPDVQQYKKKEGEANKVIALAFNAWKDSMSPYSEFVTNTRVFSEAFFDVSYVVPFDHAHDLRATVSTERFEFKFPEDCSYSHTDWDLWKARVMKSNKQMSNFFLAPSILATPWGKVWSFMGDKLEWSEITSTWEEVENPTVSAGISALGGNVPLSDDDGAESSTRTATTTQVVTASANNSRVEPVKVVEPPMNVPLGDDEAEGE